MSAFESVLGRRSIVRTRTRCATRGVARLEPDFDDEPDEWDGFDPDPSDDEIWEPSELDDEEPEPEYGDFFWPDTDGFDE
jgi:hypothetical protein